MGFRKIMRHGWPLLLAALILVGSASVPGTLALMTTRTRPLVNTFKPDGCLDATGAVTIHVEKTLLNTGDQLMLPMDFRFTLTDLETGESRFAVTDAAGRASFKLVYRAGDAGVHTYVLSEVNDEKPNVIYSELVYEIRVDVTLAEEIRTTVYLDGVQTERAVAQFENIYTSDAEEPDTGDRAAVAAYALLMLLSLAGIVTLAIRVRKYA